MKWLIFLITALFLVSGCEFVENIFFEDLKEETKPTEEVPIAEPKKEIEEEPEEQTVPELITTNEEGTQIETVSLRPACISGNNGGEIFFKVRSVPKGISFQMKEGTEEYGDILKLKGLYQQYIYFTICEDCKGGEFRLEPDKTYTFRIQFNRTGVYKKFEYSNEHLIDTGNESKYMLKVCSKEKIILIGW